MNGDWYLDPAVEGCAYAWMLPRSRGIRTQKMKFGDEWVDFGLKGEKGQKIC